MEPAKYEKNAKGNWVISQDWKEWDRRRREALSKPKPKKNAKVVTAENHREVWREIAYDPASGKKIFFCSCRSSSSAFYLGCGAVAIQRSRSGPIVQIIESRFE